jgi:uncharacterized protein (DUF1810 family)
MAGGLKLVMPDAYNLNRFVNAQGPVFEQVLTELRRGRKTSHWMWFVFPQIQGLGSSPTAVRFAIASSAEAQAYLQHNILGPRLIECSRIVLEMEGTGVDEIFGYPDHLKFHSSMTLFSAVAHRDENPEQDVFDRVLQKYFAGRKDVATMEKLR